MIRKKIKYVLIFLSSFAFSLSILLKNEINYDGNIPYNFIYNFKFNLGFFIKTFFLAIFIFLVTLLLLKLISKVKIKNKELSLSNTKLFIITFILIFITGLIYIITFYPGNVMVDTLYIFKYTIGMSSQHPIFYILLVSIPFKIFSKIFGDLNLAVFLTSIIQLSLMSTIISYMITWFNRTFKNKTFTILLIIYFSTLPIVTNFNVSLVKDSIFSVVLLCFIPLVYEIISTKGSYISSKRNMGITIVILSLLSLIRNNGILISIMLLSLFIIFIRKYTKRWVVISLFVVAFSVIPSFFSKKALFQEKVGIPLQQLVYTVNFDGKISKKDKVYLNKIYPYKLYKENYNPYMVDTIKWDDKFNRNYLNKTSGRFIEVWCNSLYNNFDSYIKAYILSTYGNWSFDKFYETQSVIYGVQNDDNILRGVYNVNNNMSFLKNVYKKTSKFLSGGMCFWLLVFISLFIIYNKKYFLLFLTVPLYGVWISLMIATPFSMAFRYMSPFMYLLPFISFIALIKCNSNKNC